ncbi:NADPH-dependent FMN reductase [Vagococcus hydrophili]|uniref:NAD(P)H-dependent oxidoreductase n=1 Tax=Vagococcus hydrophili TaxID=2714947 RepID=A0A6G8ASQ1_9ENTE|nr:NAD(P)H-dependent oxidoreductase [Vagococcus hydrophili]QIL48101.1 NAD(P)H-dependent oxidoreductase [Vagococcus hydrophili]
MKFGIILGSTREGRVSPQVGEYIKGIASKREHDFEIVDVKEFNLPFLGTGEGNPAWNEKIKELDGYIIIAQEYNHGFSASLKNAIDSAREEWFNKAAGIVSYGSAGGVRASEQLRQVFAEQKVATVRTNPAFNLFTDFENFSTFKPGEHMEAGVNDMLDELILWSEAFKTIR